MRRLTAAALFALLSCTQQPSAPREPPVTAAPSPTAEPIPPPSATVRLVADDDPTLAAYLEGIRFAIREVTDNGDLDLDLLDGPSVEGSLGLDPEAVIVVGDPQAVSRARTTIEEARVPVILVGGDLYTGRALFRYAFQTAVPVRWQARVLASYLIEDRQHTRTALVTPLQDNAVHGEAFNEAWLEEGASLERIASADGSGSFDAIVADLEGLDSVVFTGGPSDAAQLSRALSTLEDPPQLAVTPEAFDPSFASSMPPAPGTVGCYTYAWSGWADMLPRVHSFRERFAATMGRYPGALEQEGYDSTMTLAAALVRSEGEGGERLVQELEAFREETYASVPVRLGPDDHVLAEQSHLGLFAVEAPGVEAPGEAIGDVAWRPILRTFTTDGEKMNFLDRDKKIFFPFWHPKRPTPKYWRAGYGIISRSSDPLH